MVESVLGTTAAKIELTNGEHCQEAARIGCPLRAMRDFAPSIRAGQIANLGLMTCEDSADPVPPSSAAIPK